MKTFSSRLATARKNKGLTQLELANAAGVSLRSVQNWEDQSLARQHSPGAKNLRKISEILGCSIQWLIAAEESANPSTLSAIHRVTEDQLRGHISQDDFAIKLMVEKCREHLDRLLAEAHGHPERLGWISEQLREHLPLNSARTERWRHEDKRDTQSAAPDA